MLGPAILALSRSRLAARAAGDLPGIRRFSRRFVAGTTRADALAAIRRLNAAGFEATTSFLGEAVTSPAEARSALDEVTGLARDSRAAGLRTHLSVKLTELGLAFDVRLARRNLGALLAAARDAGVFVRIDMEESRYAQATLDVFREARAAHDNVGVVIQAYLHRSAADIEALAREGAPVRLVKGAYREPASVAFQDKPAVDAAYARLADAYFGATDEGGWLAVATHDERMVRAALRSARAHGAGRATLEFQMLYGIRGDLQRRLRDEGHRVRIYVPYGTHWYPYLMRRLAERPANLWFFLRGAFR